MTNQTLDEFLSIVPICDPDQPNHTAADYLLSEIRAAGGCLSIDATKLSGLELIEALDDPRIQSEMGYIVENTMY